MWWELAFGMLGVLMGFGLCGFLTAAKMADIEEDQNVWIASLEKSLEKAGNDLKDAHRVTQAYRTALASLQDDVQNRMYLRHGARFVKVRNAPPGVVHNGR